MREQEERSSVCHTKEKDLLPALYALDSGAPSLGLQSQARSALAFPRAEYLHSTQRDREAAWHLAKRAHIPTTVLRCCEGPGRLLFWRCCRAMHLKRGGLSRLRRPTSLADMRSRQGQAHLTGEKSTKRSAVLGPGQCH